MAQAAAAATQSLADIEAEMKVQQQEALLSASASPAATNMAPSSFVPVCMLDPEPYPN